VEAATGTNPASRTGKYLKIPGAHTDTGEESFSLAKISSRSTGVTGLDQAIEGGFPAGTVIVAMGSPVAGVEHLARQFWEARDEAGETGLYLMIDGDLAPGMVDAKVTPPDAVSCLFKGDRIVVDSISGLILVYGMEAAYTCISAAKQHCIRTGGNVMFIYYSSLHTPVEDLRVIRAADVLLELKQVIFMNEIERQLAVHKLKGRAVPKRIIPFNISEKGIELSTTSRVV
jgi:KaiC/GvpD/RAD55 family RecA-like ATPase